MPVDEIQNVIPHLFFKEFHRNLAMNETSLAVVRTVTTALGFRATPCVARLEVESLAHDTRLLLSFPAVSPSRARL